jgi:hypothetical protein
MSTTINSDRKQAFEKLKACIVYACSKGTSQENHLDHIKLNKVLWYADSASYLETGKSISDAGYIRRPNGPVARLMSPAMIEVQKLGQVKGGKKFDEQRGIWADTYEYVSTQLDDGVEFAILSEDEKRFIDRAFHRVCDHTTSDVSNREIWELAQNGENLPLYAIFAEKVLPITENDIKTAFGA